MEAGPSEGLGRGGRKRILIPERGGRKEEWVEAGPSEGLGRGGRRRILIPEREDLFSEEGDKAIRKCRRRRRLGCREKAENGSGSPKVGFVISILNTKEQL